MTTLSGATSTTISLPALQAVTITATGAGIVTRLSDQPGGAGLDHQVAALVDRARDGLGHAELLGPCLVARQSSGDGAVGAEDRMGIEGGHRVRPWHGGRSRTPRYSTSAR